MTCPHHQSLEDKLNKLIATQERLVAILQEAVVKKDDFYRGLNEVRAENRKTVGLLVGVLVVIGGALGTVLKLS